MIKFYINDIVIEISFLFLSVVTLALLLDSTNTVIIGILSAFIHEISHIVAFILIGKKPKKVSFEITGILLQKDNVCMSIKQELFVLLSGSLVNILIFFCIHNLGNDSFNNIGVFATSNLILGIMNLLPLNAFDGGKIITLIISHYTNINYSYKIIKIIQIIILILFLSVYVYSVINYSFNFSLFILILYIIYTIFND